MSGTHQQFKKNILMKIGKEYQNICTVLPQYQEYQYQETQAQVIKYLPMQNNQLKKLEQISFNSLLTSPLFQKLKQNLSLFVKILQHNQHTFQRIVQYEDETPISTIQSLKKQIQQASCTVDCKSRLIDYLKNHSSSIFSLYPPLYQFPHTVHTIRTGSYSPLTLQQFCTLHEQTMQMLLVRINTPSQLKTFNYTALEEQMRSLAMYVVKRRNTLRRQVFQREKEERKMHQDLINAVMRNHYVCFDLKQEIMLLEKKISDHSLNKDVIEGVVKRIEDIERYITQEQEQIFKKLYMRKLSKRMVMLEQCKEYAKKIFQKKNNKINFEKSEKLKIELEKIKNKLTNFPKNQQQFRIIFEDIQNAFLLSEESFIESGISAEQSLLNFEKILLSNYLLEKDGRRKQNVLIRNSLQKSQISQIASSVKSKNYPRNQFLQFVSSLNIQYANQLNDDKNFDIKSLTNLSISSLQSSQLQSLKYFLHFIFSNISQQLIKDSLFPLSNDFLSFCNQFIQFQSKISNTIQPLLLHPVIKQFATTRKNIFSTIKRSLPNLIKISTILLDRVTKDMSAQSPQTSKTILTFLLAEKQLDAYMKETVDGDRDSSSGGLRILRDCFYMPLRKHVHESICLEGQSLAVLLDNVEFFCKYGEKVDGVINNIFEKTKKCKKRQDVRKMYALERDGIGGLILKGRERLKIQPCRNVNYQGVERRIAVLCDIDYVGKEGQKANNMSSQKGKQFLNIFMEKK